MNVPNEYWEMMWEKVRTNGNPLDILNRYNSRVHPANLPEGYTEAQARNWIAEERKRDPHGEYHLRKDVGGAF
jgi:hypothetical protein